MIYFMQDSKTHAIKIGYSAGGGEARKGALQTGNAHPLVLLAEVPGDQAAERDLHDRFHEDRLCGEWFKPSPGLVSYIVRAAVLDAGINAGEAAADVEARRLGELKAGDLARYCLGGGSPGDAHVRCPACGFYCTHVRRVHAYQHESASVEFSCEDGHLFLVEFRQHKGITFLQAERLRDMTDAEIGGRVELQP